MTQHFSIIGQKRKHTRKRLKPEAAAPRLVAALVKLRRYHAAIQQAWQPIQERIVDLEKDWTTRPEDFWQTLLSSLHPLQTAIQQCTTWLDQSAVGSEITPLLPIRYEIVIPLHHAYRTIDEVGIAVTAYIPICSSMRPGDLQQRNALLGTLRNLAEEIHKALDAGGSYGQKRCIRASEDRSHISPKPSS